MCSAERGASAPAAARRAGSARAAGAPPRPRARPPRAPPRRARAAPPARPPPARHRPAVERAVAKRAARRVWRAQGRHPRPVGCRRPTALLSQHVFCLRGPHQGEQAGADVVEAPRDDRREGAVEQCPAAARQRASAGQRSAARLLVRRRGHPAGAQRAVLGLLAAGRQRDRAAHRLRRGLLDADVPPAAGGSEAPVGCEPDWRSSAAGSAQGPPPPEARACRWRCALGAHAQPARLGIGLVGC